MKSKLGVKGQYKVEHWRDGKLLEVIDFPNLITNEGKNKMLDVMFHADTQITTWYIGLVDNTGYTALAATDVYDEINGTNGWDEFASYTDTANAGSATTRPEWPEDAAATQQITNSAVATFDITAAGTVKGIFLAGGGASQTKSDATTGATLWSAALFAGGDRTVANADSLKVTYTVTG